MGAFYVYLSQEPREFLLSGYESSFNFAKMVTAKKFHSPDDSRPSFEGSRTFYKDPADG